MRRSLASMVFAGVFLVAARADAYRPFDGTDADVTEYGFFELELGPAHWYDAAGQNFLIAPATVLNLGIFEDTELVVDFDDFVAIGPLRGRPRFAVLDTDVLVKHVFREGVLQGKDGVSVAVEAGPLTPEFHGARGFGASLNALLSYRWSWGTVHFNEWPSYTRDHDFDLYSGVIVEGPQPWRVRPVAEVYVEKAWNEVTTESALVGAIWTCDESFVVDAALRAARVGDASAFEARFGFTWSLPLWAPREHPSSKNESSPARFQEF
ncbi:MAG: hypothetical protein ABSF69_03900 [Polyangiaceae bacterium]